MYKIGVDLGGTNIAIGLIDQTNKMVAKDSVKTGKSVDAIINDMADLVLKILESQGLTTEAISHVGIGVPGTCDYEVGIIKNAPNIGFINVNIREKIEAKLKLPVYIENDANAAALGEAVAGAGSAHQNTLMVTLGTGVGVGVVLNGQVIKGDVESGHMTIDIDGPLCGCGNRGCFEAFASATALIRGAKAAASSQTTNILDFAKSIDTIEAKDAFDAADAGDPAFKALIDDYITHLSIGITNLVNAYPVDAVILGGGISARTTLIPPLMEAVKKVSFIKDVKPIYAATLGNDAGIYGAAFIQP